MRVSTGEHEDDADHGSERSLHDLESGLLLLLSLPVAREHDGVPLDVARPETEWRSARSLPVHECLARCPLPLYA